jgi:hypothetical protein
MILDGSSSDRSDLDRIWLGQELNFEPIEFLIASSNGDLFLLSSDRLDDSDGSRPGQRDVWSDGEG